MARPKTKSLKTCAFSLDEKIVKKLEQYSKETMIPKTRIVEKAIEQYLERQKRR